MNLADCFTNELEFRICTNCKNIQNTNLQAVWKNVSVYQRLIFSQ